MPRSTKSLRKLVNEKLAEKARWYSQVKFENELLEKSKLDVDNHYIAQGALQEVTKEIQDYTHNRVSSLVSKCLKMVFPDPYIFEIEFTRKRGKTDARLLFVRREHQLDPLDSSGGGVVDVAAFALRVSCLKLQMPTQRPVVILDEPFRNVSPEYRHKIRMMLEMLSEELRFQFLQATNMRSIQSGTIINLE